MLTMTSTPSKSSRRSPGEVRDAIVTTLREDGNPMRVDEICAAVSVRLKSEVPSSSVRSYLNLNCGAGKTFTRVDRGLYRLAK